MLAIVVTSGASAQEFRLSGLAESDNIGYFEATDTAGHWGRSELLAQIDGLAVFGRTLRLFGRVEPRVDFADHDRDRVHVREAYADVRHKALDVRLGRQIIAWGKADIVNPTDNLSPRDFTDPLEADDERLGVWAIRPRLQFGDALWEGVVVPVFTPSVLPYGSERWSPPIPSQVPNPGNPGQMLRLDHVFLPPNKPAGTFENMQYATRLSSTVRGWDVSASYFDGWEDVPRLVPQLSISGPDAATLQLTPEFRRKRAVGGDFATVVQAFTLRGEAAYIRPDPFLGPDYVQYVLGVERTAGDMLSKGGTFVLVQWIHSILPDDFDPAPLDFNYLFERAVTARVQHNVTTAAQVAVEGLYEWARHGYYIQPSASYRVGDHVRVEGFVDLLGGRETEFFGLFADNKRIQFRIRYTF
jgi:hypothetical protein